MEKVDRRRRITGMLPRTIGLVLGLGLPLAAQIPHPEPFRWEPDLATATAESKETGRPIAAYFTFET